MARDRETRPRSAAAMRVPSTPKTPRRVSQGPRRAPAQVIAPAFPAFGAQALGLRLKQRTDQQQAGRGRAWRRRGGLHFCHSAWPIISSRLRWEADWGPTARGEEGGAGANQGGIACRPHHRPQQEVGENWGRHKAQVTRSIQQTLCRVNPVDGCWAWAAAAVLGVEWRCSIGDWDVCWAVGVGCQRSGCAGAVWKVLEVRFQGGCGPSQGFLHFSKVTSVHWLTLLRSQSMKQRPCQSLAGTHS